MATWRLGGSAALLASWAACAGNAGQGAVAATPASPALPAPPSAALAPPPVGGAATPRPRPPAPVVELQRAIAGSHGAADAVASLTTEVGARLAGSTGDKRAVAWALDAMAKRGLSHVHAEPVKVPVWQRGVETASIVRPVAHRLAVTALGWSGATPQSGVEADVVRFDSIDALTAAEPKAVTGKIAFIDVKMKPTAAGPGYGTAVAARSQGPAQAAKKGAVAVVIRSIGTDSSRFPHTGSMHRENSAKDALPAGALSIADADLLDRVLEGHGSARLALNLGPRWLPDAESANVVGEVPGRDRPSEVVLLGAHLDSWDLGEGAIDDGAGCAIVLEAGRALAALPTKPRRTVRIVLFAAEENSLSGGHEYARAHAGEAGHFVAAMEADLGADRVLRARISPTTASKAALALLAPALQPLSVSMSEDKAHGGADITPLMALGVPAVDLAQDPTRYFDTHHTANDTFARIDSDSITQAAAAFASAAWTIADSDVDLGRVAPGDDERD